ncbi:MAG: hypothetical protein ACXV2E_04245 [Halobacteriota archaeon]
MLKETVDEIALRRSYVFFKRLDGGGGVIADADFKSSEFVHAFISTINYVSRTRREEKTRLFADLFHGYYLNQRFDEDADIYEEHLKLLEELSYGEFQILIILHDLEQESTETDTTCWIKFLDKLESELHIGREDVPAALQRLTRTGLYETQRGFLTPNDNIDRGKLSPNFYSFLAAFKFDQINKDGYLGSDLQNNANNHCFRVGSLDVAKRRIDKNKRPTPHADEQPRALADVGQIAMFYFSSSKDDSVHSTPVRLDVVLSHVDGGNNPLGIVGVC